MSTMRSSVIEHPSVVSMFAGLWDDAYIKPMVSNRISEWTDAAIEACMEFAGRSCVSQPHFKWVDASNVILAPSDYQFFILDERNLDFVFIEDDDLLFREFCQTALSELEQYRAFGDGWDGEDMPAPLPESIDDAFTFLRLLSSMLDECAEAIPMLDHEGISSVAFENEQDYLSVAFYGDNRIVTYRWNSISDESKVVKGSLEEPGFLDMLIQEIAKI